MTIYVTGSEGRLGKELVRQGCFPLICDITDPKSIQKAIMSYEYTHSFLQDDIVINCAAITQVDKCQSEDQYQEAFRVNTDGVKTLYGELLKMVPGVDLIHISTDYVFDGHRGPYYEHSPQITELENKVLSPVNDYGWSKLGAELFLERVKNTTIVRTTGLFGTGNDLWEAAIKCVDAGKQMFVTNELIANQTYVPNLASNLIALCSVPTKNRPLMIHLASDDRCSRYDFVKKVITKIYGDEVAKKYIIPCRNKDIDWVAPRPTNSGLNCDFAKAFVEFGIKIITIDQGIDHCFVDRGYVDFPA